MVQGHQDIHEDIRFISIPTWDTPRWDNQLQDQWYEEYLIIYTLDIKLDEGQYRDTESAAKFYILMLSKYH